MEKNEGMANEKGRLKGIQKKKKVLKTTLRGGEDSFECCIVDDYVCERKNCQARCENPA